MDDSSTGSVKLFRLFYRQVRAEITKVLSLRSSYLAIIVAAIPAVAIAVAMSATAHVTYVLANEEEKGNVEWSSVDALYWMPKTACAVLMVWAMVCITGEFSSGTASLTFQTTQRWWLILTAKWLVAGAWNVISVSIVVQLVILTPKRIYPDVTADWSLTSTDFLHSWLSLSIYMFILTGIALGVGAAFRSAAIGATLLLVWQFAIEDAVLDFGRLDIYSMLPFVNANVFLSEESINEPPPWGTEWSGTYFFIIALLVFLAGVAIQTYRVRSKGRWMAFAVKIFNRQGTKQDQPTEAVRTAENKQ